MKRTSVPQKNLRVLHSVQRYTALVAYKRFRVYEIGDELRTVAFARLLIATIPDFCNFGIKHCEANSSRYGSITGRSSRALNFYCDAQRQCVSTKAGDPANVNKATEGEGVARTRKRIQSLGKRRGCAIMGDAIMDLSSVVHSHCIFFDRLVELIPAKFYVPNEETSDTWTFKKNKAARLAAKITTKENLKKAKRNRLDPDKFKSTLQVLQEKKIEPEKNGEDRTEDAVPVKAPVGVDRAVTYDELRERLHKRIEMLRSKCHAEIAAAATYNARSFQNEKKKESLKIQNEKKQESLKRSLMKSALEEQETLTVANSQENPSKRQKVGEQASKNTVKNQIDVEPTELEFSRVKMGLESTVVGLGRKRRKETKEELLAKAIQLQEKMQDPEKGGEVITKHSWSAAVSRAAGEKVLDNPKLLKNSMKRDKQLKLKSSKKWKERKDMEKKASSEKQKTRKDNISQRIQSSKERAIAKREKKLMRPGFEGRKAGFINT